MREIPRQTLKTIREAVNLCIEKSNFKLPCEAYITLTDNDNIRNINKQFRGIDSATDVLSFPMIEFTNGEPQILPGDINPENERVFLGDIIISIDKACEQSQNYNHSFERELTFLVIHGMFHLLGFDHEKEEDEIIMIGKQNEILDQMNIKRE